MDWLPKSSKKGMSERTIFISMITTFIIAIYEPQSPLREHMREAAKGGLGDAWTEKYSMPFLFSFPSFPNLIFLLLFLGSKGITHGLLVRLGILWGEGTAALEKGSFGKSWGCHHPTILHETYRRLRLALMSNDIHAPFDALSILIGPRNSRIFCRDHLALYYRPSSPLPSSASYDSDTMDINDD
jgi:hypothetical protein